MSCPVDDTSSRAAGTGHALLDAAHHLRVDGVSDVVHGEGDLHAWSRA